MTERNMIMLAIAGAAIYYFVIRDKSDEKK